MKSILFITCFSLLFQACKDSTKANSKSSIIKLDYAYSLRVQSVSYSLKFSTGDTVYIQDHLPSGSDTSYYALLHKQDKLRIDSLINNMNLSALDSSYDSHDDDGEEFNLTISKNDTLKIIYIHSEKIPREIKNLTDWVMKLRKTLVGISYGK